MLIKKIRDDIKEAMIMKTVIKKDVLKMVVQKAEAIAKDLAIKNKENLSEIVISDECVLEALKKEEKQLIQTKEILEKNNKEDSKLYYETWSKIVIIKNYLPKELCETELKEEVLKIINSLEDKTNRGLVMKSVMSELKGKADGKLINKIVSDILIYNNII